MPDHEENLGAQVIRQASGAHGRPGRRDTGGPRVPVARILCPIDFSEASAHAIDQAVAVAGWYKARITALHVCSPMFLSVPGLDISGSGEATNAIKTEGLRNQTAAHCEAATTAGIGLDILIDIGQPASHILERANSLPADLIVMGTHGTGGVLHLVLGSVTERVLRKAGLTDGDAAWRRGV